MISNRMIKNLGLGAVSAAFIGITGVMMWTPTTETNEAETPEVNKPKINSSTVLGKLPKNDKDKEKKEDKKEENPADAVDVAVVYNNDWNEDYGYNNYDYGYNDYGYGGATTTTTYSAIPDAHVEQNTVANQAVVEEQAAEEAAEQAAEEAKEEVAEQELEVVVVDETISSIEDSYDSIEDEKLQETVVVTDDGEIEVDEVESDSEEGNSSIIIADNREVIDMGEISFDDEVTTITDATTTSEVVTSVSTVASATTTPSEVVTQVPEEDVSLEVIEETVVYDDSSEGEVIITDEDTTDTTEPVNDFTDSSYVVESSDGVVITEVELLEEEGTLEVVMLDGAA